MMEACPIVDSLNGYEVNFDEEPIRSAACLLMLQCVSLDEELEHCGKVRHCLVLDAHKRLSISAFSAIARVWLFLEQRVLHAPKASV